MAHSSNISINNMRLALLQQVKASDPKKTWGRLLQFYRPLMGFGGCWANPQSAYTGNVFQCDRHHKLNSD